MIINLKDERLNERWRILVRSQMKVASPLAAGVGVLPDSASAFAATQAAYRFFNNDRIELSELIEPLRQCARDRVATTTSRFVLVAHDWCKLSFPGHSFRKDMAELSRSSDVGYEVTMSLAISADDGSPLAPVEMHMKTKDGILSTLPGVVPGRHLDQLLPTMNSSASWNLGKPVLNIIDQEADSVGHWRVLHAAKHYLLIRGDDRVAEWEGRSLKLSQIRKELEGDGTFVDAGEAMYHGRPARLQVAEVDVILKRPARTKIGRKQVSVPGPPLPTPRSSFRPDLNAADPLIVRIPDATAGRPLRRETHRENHRLTHEIPGRIRSNADGDFLIAAGDPMAPMTTRENRAKRLQHMADSVRSHSRRTKGSFRHYPAT